MSNQLQHGLPTVAPALCLVQLSYVLKLGISHIYVYIAIYYTIVIGVLIAFWKHNNSKMMRKIQRKVRFAAGLISVATKVAFRRQISPNGKSKWYEIIYAGSR